jgi:DNA repair protein RecO
MLSIVLGRRDWRENDQIITLYTEEKGKVEALARGIKKIISKNSPAVMPFCLLNAEIIPGKEIARLGAAEPISIFKNIRANLTKSLAAGFAVKILGRLSHLGEPDKKIFALFVSWLKFLDNNNTKFNLIYLDALFAKLFIYLGFDISHDEKLNNLEKAKLNNIINLSWEKLASLNLIQSELIRVHKAVHKFAVYHAEIKIADWQKLANFS